MMPGFDDSTHQVDVAILVALSLEAAPLLERLQDTVKLTASAGPKITIGQLKQRRVAVMATGVGKDAAIRGARLTIEGHRPKLVVAAGLCGGLASDLARGEVVVASSVTRLGGAERQLSQASELLAVGRHRQVRVVTADQVVDTPEAKRDLRTATAADVVDMESWWIADVAEAEDTPWAVVRSVSDTADERIPQDVAKLASVTHPARLAGAAARLLFRRPAAIADLAQLREHACSAADRLAEAFDVMLGR